MRIPHASGLAAPQVPARRRSFPLNRKSAAGALTALAIVALFLAAPSSAATRVETWAREIREASKRFAIPEEWIRNVMRVESDGRVQVNGLPITSPAGAMGLMQLMPGTWEAMRRAYRLGDDPYDPRDNILAGAAYLRAMYEDYGYPGAVAAYNAGPGRFAEFLANGRPLPPETISYVDRVVGHDRSPKYKAVRTPALRSGKKHRASANTELFFVARLHSPKRGSAISDAPGGQPVAGRGAGSDVEGSGPECRRENGEC